MLGSTAPDSVRARRRTVYRGSLRSQGGAELGSVSHRAAPASGQKQKLEAGEIYNVDTLVQCGFVMEERTALRLRAERPDGSQYSLPERQLSLRGAAERREGNGAEPLRDSTGRVLEAGDDLGGDTAKRRTHRVATEEGATLYTEETKRSVEAVWGSFLSRLRSKQGRAQLSGQAASVSRTPEKEGEPEAIEVPYVVEGEEAAGGPVLGEARIRCLKAGARAAAARRKHFCQGNACARLAAWTHPPGDTAFQPMQPTSLAERRLAAKRRALESSPHLRFGVGLQTPNYHLHALKPPLPTGPRKDSLAAGSPWGEEVEDRQKVDVEGSLIFLDPRTRRLQRRQAMVRLAPSAAPGTLGFPDAAGGQQARIFTPGGGAVVGGVAGQLPLVADEKSLETTAKLFEAFERCHPDAAGWLLTNDIRWTLPRDRRVQEIFGLVAKQQLRIRRQSRGEDVGDQGEREGNDDTQEQRETNGSCFFLWSSGANALAWAKDLLRNRDEPVRFVCDEYYTYTGRANRRLTDN